LNALEKEFQDDSQGKSLAKKLTSQVRSRGRKKYSLSSKVLGVWVLDM
jgi:hypothetical protein